MKNKAVSITNSNGELYEGQVKEDIYHGIGVLTYPNGTRYFGKFKNGVYHGIGTISFSSGISCVAEFKDGDYHGVLNVILPNKDSYVGICVKGKYKGTNIINPHKKIRKSNLKGANYKVSEIEILPNGEIIQSQFKTLNYWEMLA